MLSEAVEISNISEDLLVNTCETSVRIEMHYCMQRTQETYALSMYH
jgi:hypothetical protein